MKKTISIVAVIIWTLIIFFASTKTSTESNTTSKEFIYNNLKVAINITNKIKLTNSDIYNEKWIENKVDILNKPIRKCAHAFIYFVLSILLCLCLKVSGINENKMYLLVLLNTFCYSLTDEFHQLFVSGRTGQFSDCLIDTSGAILGILLFKVILIIKNKNYLKTR